MIESLITDFSRFMLSLVQDPKKATKPREVPLVIENVEPVRPLVAEICEIIRSRGVTIHKSSDVLIGIDEYSVLGTNDSMIITTHVSYKSYVNLSINGIPIKDMYLNKTEESLYISTCQEAVSVYVNTLEKQKIVLAETQIADHINKIR